LKIGKQNEKESTRLKNWGPYMVKWKLFAGFLPKDLSRGPEKEEAIE
jgi:hypothetical protein